MSTALREWLGGTLLVAQRGVLERIRARSFRLVTALLLLVSVGAVVVPRVLSDRPTVYTLATVGPVPGDVAAVLSSAGRAGGFQVGYVTRTTEGEVRQTVAQGDADAGLVETRLYTNAQRGSPFPLVVSQTVVSVETARVESELGLTPEQVTRLQAVGPPVQVPVAPLQDAARGAVGFAVGLVLYMALLFAGTTIATAVATEKTSRISEVLLAVLRPSQVLVGTVLAAGAATLAQLLALGVPFAVGSWSTAGGLPASAAGDIALAVVWFLLGFGLYAFAFAATGALVSKVTEVGNAVMPLTLLLVSGYAVAIFVVMKDPSGFWSVAASLFPLTAPITMPFRWGAGDVPAYQLVLAMALTLGAAVLLLMAASSVYRRALLITDRRVRLRAVLRRSP